LSGSDWPPHLTVDVEPVLRLFTGENFYSSADAALREAVLNAIDAIGRRQQTEAALSPEIEITFDQTMKTISVTDNGDGMDRGDVATLFTKVGSTASQIARAGAQQYRAVGEFGIGALSYFLVSDEYHLHTRKTGQEALGLRFTAAMLDGRSQAQAVPPTRVDVGTTVILFAKSPELFEQLRSRFNHWMRNVLGLRACVIPDNIELKQGGLTRNVRKIHGIAYPAWVEEADLGPPEDLDVWDQYDGRGRVDVLYRGVFVERLEVEQLWGFEGAIHVDPKHFRPKLNREGFVGDKLKADVTPFLRSLHPAVLKEAIWCIGRLLRDRGDWSLQKAVTLWLAVPRSADYSEAFQVWDAEFRNRRAFRVLLRETEQEMSIADLVAVQAEHLYLAPERVDQSNPVISQAIRVLRARGALVVQGLQRQDGYLTSAPMTANSTAWLLLNTFRTELPVIIEVTTIAETVVSEQSVADIYTVGPVVKLVRLGAQASPFVAVRDEIWINMESDAGRKIVLEICKRNEGHLGLWVACMMFAPEQSQALDQVASLLRRMTPRPQRLGLVHRQFVRSLLG
jgi:Histidine kinase-, DNA gyrase B-, and HSP90-like ATPase